MSLCDLDLTIWLGFILETVRCRNFILGRDIGWWDVAGQCHSVTLI